jgi:catechol 2,3-dioxygenase-like lactoylglutathione lyase family enzyme
VERATPRTPSRTPTAPEGVGVRLESAGVPHEVHSSVSVYFRDPDGARIELIADPLGDMYGHHNL